MPRLCSLMVSSQRLVVSSNRNANLSARKERRLGGFTLREFSTLHVKEVIQILLSDQTGCRTGNGEKLSSSQAEPPQAIKSAVVQLPSISCATSCLVTQYRMTHEVVPQVQLTSKQKMRFPLRGIYRLTIQVVTSLPLTSKQRFCFSYGPYTKTELLF